MKNYLLLAACLMLFLRGYSQNCSQRLSQLERDYEAGKLLRIPEEVEKLLKNEDDDSGYKCKLSKEEQVRAKKLLTKTYIFTDEEIKSEEALVDLLKTDPEHFLDKQVDPRELFFLMDQFQTDPIIRVALKVGVNTTFVNVIESFGTGPLGEGISYDKFYNGRTKSGDPDFEQIVPGNEQPSEFPAPSTRSFGFSVELMAERHIKYGIEVGLGAQIRVSNYNIDAYIVDENTWTSATNKQVYFRTPLLVRYNLFYNKHKSDPAKYRLKPYAFAGISADFLMSAQYVDASRSGGTSFTLDDNNDLTAKEQVNEFDYSIFFGFGVKYRIATHYLTADIRYDNARNNYINGDNRYANKSSVFDSGFVEDNLSLNVVSFNVGFTYSIYSPKKLKEYR
ncbi:MAG: PorT family protein [Cyclobacteriaceae bacterium]